MLKKILILPVVITLDRKDSSSQNNAKHVKYACSHVP